jgi:DNA-binding helix-hairpin-helix protein with protein kinase domain
LSVLAVLIPIILAFTLPVAIGFGGWWAALVAMSPLAILKRDRKRRLAERQREFRFAGAKWESLARKHVQLFQSAFARLDKLQRDYHELDAQMADEQRQLRNDAMARQRDEFLRHQLIRDAKIQHLGNGRKSTLASFGIETAFDVDGATIRAIHGFGEAITATLLAWRRSVEAGFVFNASKGLPQSVVDALEIKYYQGKIPIEQELVGGPARLRSIVEIAKRELEPLVPELGRLDYERAQARADLDVCAKTKR